MHKLIQDKKVFMNTTVEFTAWTEKERVKAYQFFDEGFNQFEEVIKKFSRFDKKSELSKLNNSRGKKTNVTKELFQLIKKAVELAELTKGSYDPTVIDFLETYGYGSQMDFSSLENRKLIEKEIGSLAKNRSSYKEIEMDKSSHSIRLQPNQRLDLGSIGKGYAIDLAYQKLLPLKNFLINAGGDLKASGMDNSTKPWLVELKVPSFKTIGKINLKDTALCCSGSWARKVKYFHHLIDTSTGVPQDKLKAVFVQSENAIDADAWSTALFVAGNKASSLIKKNNLKAILVHSDNKISAKLSLF